MGDVDQALALLDTLEGQIKGSTTIVEDEKSGSYTAINNLRTDIKSNTAKTNDKKEDIANLINSLTVITDNFTNFTSGDGIKIAQGVVNIIGGIGSVVAGPYGPIVGAACGLVSSILSLFGGGGPSLSEQLQEIIEQALEDFKDQDIYEQIMGSINDIRTLISQMVGMARYNGGIVTEGEKSFLTEAQITLVGNDTLGVLQGQLDNYKEDDDDSKSKRLAVYAYNYANLCYYKVILLNIHIGLLRRNDMESMAQGVLNYLNTELPSQGRGVLGFMSSLPDSKVCNYWRLFRYLHGGLSAPQRSILAEYRNNINLTPFPGVLCCLYHIDRSEYAYSPDAKYNSERRHFFRWGGGKATNDALYRIVDAPNGKKYIFSVWYGEYVYASATKYNGDRRYIFSWTPGCVSETTEASWEIKGDWDKDCSIKNVKYNEYLFSSSIDWGSGRYYNLCWTPGSLDNDAHWQIRECSYESTADLTKPMD